MAPPKVRIDRKEDCCWDRLGAALEPELMIALAIGDAGVETIGGQFAEDR